MKRKNEDQKEVVADEKKNENNVTYDINNEEIKEIRSENTINEEKIENAVKDIKITNSETRENERRRQELCQVRYSGIMEYLLFTQKCTYCIYRYAASVVFSSSVN